MSSSKKRSVCFVITSFIHYSRNILVLDELRKRSDVELHVVLAGTALSAKYTSVSIGIKERLAKAGFEYLHEMHFNLEGDNYATKTKTTGLGIIEFSSLLEQIKPDVVVIRGDRFEVLSAAVAAALMNISIAHIEGGDLSGTIDESVRHAVSKLSHIHFATNNDAANRLQKMGENPKYIFNFGSPDLEVPAKLGMHAPDITVTGSGASLDLSQEYIIVLYHPVASEFDDSISHTKTVLDAVHDLGVQTVWFWPNFDVGSEQISRQLRIFNDQVQNHKIRFMRYLHPEEWFGLLRNAKALVGNSSAGIKECSFLGVPVVNIGTRQQQRLRGPNVVDVPHDSSAIKNVIRQQILHGKYQSSSLYLGESPSKNIAYKIATVSLYTQKIFYEKEEHAVSEKIWKTAKNIVS
ncbi:MAG: UDP-N-acetylglucosamine 2-epimerase [Parcubacteria group bacterium Gr01-1014_48]|nr:MAG: UDP-N-acetylglucosamine 2-epimerase [Parcubacteria group bacterium Greene0416_14]TSC74444.1 MAG: UDP-N-acetylglucosamine 2-epimerase [Parcubacteria group bacterium Gr01-1014_48]TSD01754.1 MAG: UDP-N-acetylglucosamine 2-epimerase [Parcubacteria group bacterium Greene1014_15]TSD08468.1 MAG: UDP-N-acetylglucosamine 2-epimerase [Parcubacteria group bacterium Greene0714_4]